MVSALYRLEFIVTVRRNQLLIMGRGMGIVNLSGGGIFKEAFGGVLCQFPARCARPELHSGPPVE